MTSAAATSKHGFFGRLRKLAAEEWPKVVILLLFISVWVLVLTIEHQFEHMSTKEIVLAGLTTFGLGTLVIVVAAILARQGIAERIDAALALRLDLLEAAVQRATEALSFAHKAEIQHQIARLEALAAGHSDGFNTQVKELSDLGATLKQTVSLSKQDYILVDWQVRAVEKSASKDVMVIAPDLYYEKTEEYQQIIAENIAKAIDGPVYRYVIPDNDVNTIAKEDVVEQLVSRVRLLISKDSAPRDAVDLVSKRFQIKLVPIDRFPASVLYGLALYRSNNGPDRLLQYLPRNLGLLNVVIPNVDKELPHLYDRVRHHFEAFFKP